jgi:hypothetical protein
MGHGHGPAELAYGVDRIERGRCLADWALSLSPPRQRMLLRGWGQHSTARHYRSAEWAGLASSTQVTYRGILERFRAEYGDKPVPLLQREHVRSILAKKAATPQAANNLRKLIRLLMRFAVAEGWRRDDPTVDVKAIKVRSDGFHTWTENDIAAFKKRWPVGTKQRVAMELALHTGQRRSDLEGCLKGARCTGFARLHVGASPKLGARRMSSPRSAVIGR